MTISRLGTYVPQTSWDNTGNYDGTYDNLVADVDADAGISITRGRDQARGRGTGRIAASNHTLNNASRRYSAEYAGSPLAHLLLPGRPHRIGVTFGDGVTMDDDTVRMDDTESFMDGTGTGYLFTGSVDEIEQRPALGERRVTVHALGSLLKLSGRRVTTQLYESITTGQAVQYALIAAGLSSTEYSVDSDMVSNGRQLDYWYADDEDLTEVLNRLIFDTEGYPAAMYERGNGVIAVEGRNYRTLNTRCTDVQAVFWDVVTNGDASMNDALVLMDDPRIFMDGGGAGLYHTGFRYTPGIRDVVNATTQEIVTRTAAASAVIWTYGQTVTLDSSGAATVIAKPNDPFKTAIVPSTGGGDFTVSVGTVTVALSRTSGGSTTITFSGGTASATISNLRLRAQSMAATSTTRVTNQLNMATSIAAYGTRSSQLNGYPGLSMVQAAALCDGVVYAYQDPRPLIEFDLVNGSGRLLYQIMQREISDRVRIIDSQTGVDLEVILEQVTHTISAGRVHTATFACEKVVESGWAIYGTDVYDTGIYGQ